MSRSTITDFKIIDLTFIVNEKAASEILEDATDYADSEIGLYSLEARARKLSENEVSKYKLEGDHSKIELSIVVWEGYANEDLEEAKSWINRQAETNDISFIDLKARDMFQDEFEAFQACAPEYFEEKE
jgi:hypothetical protein